MQKTNVFVLLEHLSKMGHKEIARSYPACIKVLFTAGGAGLITAGTVFGKSFILHSSFNWAQTGVLCSIDFIISFLLIQLLDFKLATKQSPLLGAGLGKRWRELQQNNAFAGIWKNEVLWSLRTQIWSALGNIVFVIPAAISLNWIYKINRGVFFLNAENAKATLRSLAPFSSFTLVDAAITGVILWLSMFLGGLAASRFKRLSKKMTIVFFNIFLGLGLALIPQMMKRFGLPFDVRHFTLSGGMIAMAASSLDFATAIRAGLFASVIGVLLVGFFNFSVSFCLAFIVSIFGATSPLQSLLNSAQKRAILMAHGSKLWSEQESFKRPFFSLAAGNNVHEKLFFKFRSKENCNRSFIVHRFLRTGTANREGEVV